MRVFNNNQVYFVGWQYDNPSHPFKTDCILRNDKKEEVARVTVTKHAKDVQSKEKARRFSLGKLLKELYPGRDMKGLRKMFWDAYRNRNVTDTPNKAPVIAMSGL